MYCIHAAWNSFLSCGISCFAMLWCAYLHTKCIVPVNELARWNKTSSYKEFQACIVLALSVIGMFGNLHYRTSFVDSGTFSSKITFHKNGFIHLCRLCYTNHMSSHTIASSGDNYRVNTPVHVQSGSTILKIDSED